METIKIIGAGQLGSRHLQALKEVQIPLEIEVVDPSNDSLMVAKERYEAVLGGIQHKVEFRNEIGVSDKTEIIIVATNSAIRRQVIEDLLKRTKLSYLILEKILFDEQKDYLDVKKILTQAGVNTWVNCPMRMMGVYQEIKNKVKGSQIFYRVTGGQFGLVTNAIHYLDHVADLAGCIEYDLVTGGLNKQPIPSKRPGFHELTGTLLAKFKDGSVCEVTCHPDNNAPVIIEIFTDNKRFIVRESEGKMWYSEEGGGWVWSEVNAVIPFQSQLTSIIVSNLLNNGTCELTPYHQSTNIHLQLMGPVKEYLKAQGFNSDKYKFT
jgi:predicted dehydrogenase